MHEDYEKYRGSRRNEDSDIVTGRIPSNLKEQLEVIAQLEEDTLSGLVLEGVARVIESRAADPNYIPNRQQALAARIAELQHQQDTLSQLLIPSNQQSEL